jgi:hypothetical protein
LYDLGGTARLTVVVADPDGAEVNATTATLEIGLPDGTAVQPPVPDPAQAGHYQVDYVTTQAGRHTVRWLFTGPAAAFTDVFDVRPAASPQLLSVADAKRHLNKSTASDDEEIRRFIAAATKIVEDRIGPVVRREVTEVHTSRGTVVELLHHQVVAVNSVTYVDGGDIAIDPADLDVDGPAGRVRGLSRRLPRGRLKFVYTVGRPIVDEAISLAAGIIVGHLWATQRGNSGGRPGVVGTEGAPTNRDTAVAHYIGFALPKRAAELLRPFEPDLA